MRLDARFRRRLREVLGLTRASRRPGGPRLEQAAYLAVLYWECFRVVDWVDGGLKLRAPEGD